jgi:hypothetical protein
LVWQPADVHGLQHVLAVGAIKDCASSADAPVLVLAACRESC